MLPPTTAMLFSPQFDPLTRSSTGNPMAGMQQMKGPGMMGAQMQRDGSTMDMNGGQRPNSPGSNENAPSPNKRPRVDGTSLDRTLVAECTS